MKLSFEIEIYDRKRNLKIPNDYEYIKSIHFDTAGKIDFIVTEFVNVTASGESFMQEEKLSVDEVDIFIDGKKIEG